MLVAVALEKFVVRGHSPEVSDINNGISECLPFLPTHSLALLEFADMASATAWYESPEYQKIIPFRTNSGTYEAFIFEGFPPRPAMA